MTPPPARAAFRDLRVLVSEAMPGKATVIQVLLKTISRNLYRNVCWEKPELLPRNWSVLSLRKMGTCFGASWFYFPWS